LIVTSFNYSPIPKTLRALTIYPENPGIESSIGSVIAITATANKMFLNDLTISELRSIIVFPLRTIKLLIVEAVFFI